MAKVIGYKQLQQKTFHFLEKLPSKIIHSFGKLTDNFIMIIWGQSGNGKSNLILELLAALMHYGNILYVSLEEGTEFTMVEKSFRKLNEVNPNGKIMFADHEMTYDELMIRLAKKKSPRFVVIDSIQYLNITYDQYKEMKKRFKKKSFIFISHAKGKNPDGRTADKIRYDAGIKVRVEKYVAFPISRFGGNMPYIIWEQGARKDWGTKEFRKIQLLTKLKDHANEPTAEPALT
jgi:RecA-family ATPase